MISLNLSIEDRITEFIKTVPQGVKVVSLRAIGTYLLGNERRGLRHYPPRRKHDENNPYKWQTERQRKAYFASNGFGGGIPSARSGELSRAWQMTNTSDWRRLKLDNVAPYARFVQGANLQRGHLADGWRYATDVVRTNLDGAIQEGQREVNAWLKTKRNPAEAYGL